MPSFNGEVVVRALLLSERLELSKQPDPSGFARFVLHRCVVDVEGKPVFSEEEWESFGSSHYEDSLVLLGRAMKLSGFVMSESTEEEAKKSSPPK